MTFSYQLTEELQAVMSAVPSGWATTRSILTDQLLQNAPGGAAIGFSAVDWLDGGITNSLRAASAQIEVAILAKDKKIDTAWNVTLDIIRALECLGWQPTETIEAAPIEFRGGYRPIITRFARFVE